MMLELSDPKAAVTSLLIPKQFRKEGYPLDIRTRVTKDKDNKNKKSQKITKSHGISNI